MSVHRFLVAAVERDEVSFSPDQAYQLRHVLRLRPGAQVRVFDGRAPIDLLVELTSHETGRVLARYPQAPEPRTRLTAYPALLQRDKFELVLQKLTELGVSGIVPVVTARGVVREPPDAPRVARWQAILRESTEQCGRGHTPVLGAAVRFADAIQVAEGCRLMAYEGERDHGLPDAVADRPTTVSLFVGPEGGYSDQEAEQSRQAGVRLVSLGPRILRTETASLVFAALVLYELGDLSSGQP